MKYQAIVIILVSTFSKPTLLYSLSASYSLISGSPWAAAEIPPKFPSSYGVLDASNTPGGRSSHNIIVYNSLIYSFLGSSSPKSDVWAFNITDNTWTWIAGKSNTGNPSFNSLGIASPSSTPGYRYNFGGDINRELGEYVMFGGFTGSAYRGDLWVFNFTANIWTWLSGSSLVDESPTYTGIGVSSSANVPGARSAMACAVYPLTGEFLLYGGSKSQYFSDMWAFNFTSMRWTWISGSSASNIGASFGPKSQWSTSYFPGSRGSFDIVHNLMVNILFIFGGYSNTGSFNDLWAFNRDSLEWALISGSSSGNIAGSCGAKGFPSVNNSPGARYGHNLVYHVQSELLILFGGFGFTCTGSSAYLSDTWAFNYTTSEWAWISGSSFASAPVAYSVIAAQTSGAMTVDIESSAIYMFGGSGYISSYDRGSVDYLWFTEITEDPFAYLASSSRSSSREIITSSSLFSSAKRVATSLSQSSSTEYSSRKSSIQRRISSSFIISEPFSLLPAVSSLEDVLTLLETTNLDFNSLTTLTTSTGSSASGPSRKINIAQDYLEKLENLWLSKYRIYAIVVVVLLVLMICIILKFLCCRKKGNLPVADEVKSVKSDTTSTVVSEFQSSDSSTMTFSNGQTTFTTQNISLYLPGGLRVDSREAYRLETAIAQGGGGSVWIATAFEPILKEFGEKVVVKIPNAKMMNERAIALFHQEVSLMNAFKRNQNIAKLLGYSDNPHSIILKHYPCGTLSKWFSSWTRTKRQSHAFASDISTGISVLHSNGVVHCDMKPDNVLIDNGSRLFAVISDFGISRIVTEVALNVSAYKVQNIKGASVAYAAPEAIAELRQKPGPKVLNPNETMARDIYAIGMIVLAIFNGKSAWK
eukprot:Partr_v1_DN27600_c0_g1_i4_m30176 putative Inherit from NOG: hedgehog protein